MRAYVYETAVMVIDYQEKLVPAMNNRLEFVHNSEILLKGLMELNVPAIMTQQYTRGLGETIPEIKEIDDMPDAFDKITFSCLADDDISMALEKLKVKNVIVCGCETHICVLQTVMDLIGEEYNVYVVSDCVASRREKDKEAALTRAEQEGAFITTYEAILFELLERAGSDQFKTISKLIR